jgi:membrane-associated phospholipid phosphatase
LKGKRPGRRLVLWTIPLLFGVSNPARADEAAAPSAAVFSRGDLWFGAAVVLGVAAATQEDATARGEVLESSGQGSRRAALLGEHLGNPLYLGPVLALTYGGARLLRRPGLSASCARIGESVVAAIAACELLKYPIGRARPPQSGSDPDLFRPFSGWSSFPSGHTTVAFATAAAIDREADRAWVRWVVYPFAGLVGWSRLHDDRHWMSDVVAGAALGWWAADKVDRLAAASHGRSITWLPVLESARSGWGLAGRIRF